MPDPRPQFSLRGALAATGCLAISLGLLRLGMPGWRPPTPMPEFVRITCLLVGAQLFVATIGALVGGVVGHRRGVVAGLVLALVIALAALVLLPGVE